MIIATNPGSPPPKARLPAFFKISLIDGFSLARPSASAIVRRPVYTENTLSQPHCGPSDAFCGQTHALLTPPRARRAGA